MVQRSVNGFPAPSFWTPHSSVTFILNSRTSLVGHQEASLEGGVLWCFWYLGLCLSPPSPFLFLSGRWCVWQGAWLASSLKQTRHTGYHSHKSSPPYKPGPDSTTLPVNSVLFGSTPSCLFLSLAAILFR